jgi:phosphohistidine phosphatase SixA
LIDLCTADPDLTDVGRDQALRAHNSWKAELAFGLPLPEKFYCSPMTRALRTHTIIFNGIVGETPKTVILEVRIYLCTASAGVDGIPMVLFRTAVRSTASILVINGRVGVSSNRSFLSLN